MCVYLLVYVCLFYFFRTKPFDNNGHVKTTLFLYLIANLSSLISHNSFLISHPDLFPLTRLALVTKTYFQTNLNDPRPRPDNNIIYSVFEVTKLIAFKNAYSSMSIPMKGVFYSFFPFFFKYGKSICVMFPTSTRFLL